jgi:SPP1 gp7 family putative phage head morphogenesis protein
VCLAIEVRPVFQTRIEALGATRGNCAQAAVASFLNLPLEEVPDFMEHPHFDRSVRAFFRAHGFDLIDKPLGFMPRGYYFERGTSYFGHEHIVLMRAGHLMHDPNPLGRGLRKRESVLWPRPITSDAVHIAFDAKQPEPTDEIVLRDILPNEGVRAWYRDLLQDMARRMACDILRKLRRHAREASNRLAQDDDPVVTLRRVMSIWGRLWQKRFDDMSKDIAKSFAGRTQRYTDAALRRRMREAGFTVRFRPTERQVSAFRAIVAENVGLIRSIPREFHRDVESRVWSSVMRGGTMGELADGIRKKYGVTYRRAAFIARDQVNKSKSVLEDARRAELGITEAEWHHSHAGKEPRPTHVKMDGKRYKIADGMYDSAEGRNVKPGELINCRCTSRAVIPGRLGKRAK